MQESLIHRITNRIRYSLELQEILDAAVVEIRDYLRIDRVKIYRFHTDGHGEVIAESINNAQLPSLLGLHFPADDIPIQAREAFVAVRQRSIVDVEAQQIRIEQFDADCPVAALEPPDIRLRSVDPCHVEYLKAMGVRSSLVIPLLYQNSLWGLLAAHHSQPRPFSPDELELTQLMADQVSVAIAQAILYADVRTKAQQAATINLVILSLHCLPEIDLQTGLELTVRAFGNTGGRLYWMASSDNKPLLYHYGDQPTNLACFQASILEQNILWKEYFRPSSAEQRPATSYPVNDIYAEPRLRVIAAAFRNTAIRGMLVIPLLYHQDCLGYLTLFRNEINVETVWAGQFDPDQRQLQPRNSFTAWTEERLCQSVDWTLDEVSLAESLGSQFAIAIYEYDLYQQLQRENLQRQQMEKMLVRRAEEEQLRSVILQRIRQSLDLHTILDTTVAEVRQFLQTDRVLLYQFAPDWSGKVVAESVSYNNLSLFGQEFNDPCFSVKGLYKPYQQGRVSQIRDIHSLDLPSCYVDMLHQMQVQANLVVPILMNSWEQSQLHSQSQIVSTPLLWGLLIAHNCIAPRQWQAWEVSFLQQLAVQVAIALNQAELYHQVQCLNGVLEQQVQARTAELSQALAFESLLKRITDKVRDSLDEHQILQIAVAELSNGLQVNCADAALYDLENRTSTICYEHSLWNFSPAIGLTVEMDNRPTLYDFLLSGYHIQFCLLPGFQNLARKMDFRYTIFACPIVDDQGVLGDISLFKPNQESFGELEVRLVQQVANQCAIALRQARLYQAAQAQVEELARLNQLKDDFLSTISHELRTPMSSIKLAIQMLEVILQKAGVLELEDHQITQYFKILNYECKREISLINNLLDITRLDAKSEPLSLTTIDLSIWLPHIVESFSMRAGERNQWLEVNVPSNLPRITTDLSYLERILSELLTNACKYTPSGETITLSCTTIDSSRLEISVTNTGVEIPHTEHDRIFDKFYRIPNNDPWKHGGTGLGLALVKRLAEYLDGTIHVATQPNQTQFIVTLPVEVEGVKE